MDVLQILRDKTTMHVLHTTPAAPAVMTIGAVTALSPDEHMTRILTAREMEYAVASVGVAYSYQYAKQIYILLKAEALRLMLLLSRCATSVATSFFFFSFLKYNLSYNFKMVFTIFNPICSTLLIYLLPLSPYNKSSLLLIYLLSLSPYNKFV